MRRRLVFGVFLIATTFGCVDRVLFDVQIPEIYGVSIDGFISDQAGPYRVNVTRVFDTESKETLRTGITARVTMLDADGNSEEMTQTSSGVYQTLENGIRGRIGGVYRLRVELNDGRIYESVPDTMYATGSMDDVRWDFESYNSVNGLQYGFRVYAKSSASEINQSKVHLMWRNKVTFKARAHPEGEQGNCYRNGAVCNFVHPCTGLQNIGTNFAPVFEQVAECTCCTCWYDAYSENILLNDQWTSANGQFNEIMIDRFPLNGWYMMFKTRVEPGIQSLSPQAYRFWRGVRDQYAATSNIFQPITGKIPGNFVQVAGKESAASGIFFATAINSKSFYINRSDIDQQLIPDASAFRSGATPCFNLFPNSSNTAPSFWEE